MKERLERILKLCDDNSYSHVARMNSIRREVQAMLAEFEEPAPKETRGRKPKGEKIEREAGDTLQKPHPPATGEIVF